MSDFEKLRAEVQGMMRAHKFQDAVTLLEPRPETGNPDHPARLLFAEALAGLGRDEDALEIFEAAIPTDPVPGRNLYNCGVILERMAHYPEAATRARQAIEAGFDSEKSHVLLAISNQGAGDYDAAESAYRTALAINPLRGDVHRDFAQLVWMRTTDADKATHALRSALQDHPNHPALVTQLAKALDFGGAPGAAYELLSDALATGPEDATSLEIAAFTIARNEGWTERALYHALRAAQTSPENPAALLAVCDAKIALGEAASIVDILKKLHERLPMAQQIAARLSTAMRLTDHPGYAQMMDYAAFVQTYDLTEVDGWVTPEAFLSDLSVALRENLTLKTHPFDQSVRNGTQTLRNIYLSDNAAIRGFFDFAKKRMKDYMSALPMRGDNFTSRNTGELKIIDAWSVRQLKGGSHLNHVHQNGWISTVFYADLPSDIEGAERAGWLKFGEPGIITDPHLPPDRFLQPRLGRLVVFPSYIWHGTTPFAGAGERLTIAFDAVPVG